MATDALMRQASCTFSVVVTPVPRIQATKFLAFGDSLTEGKPSRTPKIGPSIVVVPPDRFNQTGSYVDRLDSMLAGRYQDQEITLIADGFGGEKVSAGTLRLQTDWPQHNPEVLLLMEGTNDLTSPDPPGGVEALNAVINGLRQMIRFAKGRGARVFLGTLPPLTAPQAAEVIASARVLNAKITTLAAAEQVPLVDHFAKIPPELVDGDGIHLIPHGYELMAEDWMSAIQATLEITTH
jgi:lysophospholipase L1-like esterase